jgi:mitochondrial division protein 1
MGGTLVSGSADKTIRVWDLNAGKCVQTIDVLTVIAQSANPQLASWSIGRRAGSDWRSASFNASARGRDASPEAAFIGGLQCFENALATGTSDGIIRLWDCKSHVYLSNSSAVWASSPDVGRSYWSCSLFAIR